MADEHQDLEVGTTVSDRYRLEEELGRGGAGRVFRAHDDRLDRPVAVKVLTDLGETAVARFRREAATAARIRHPNVVTLHDAGIDGAPYLVMSLVEGPSLAHRVESDGPLGPTELQRLASDLFAGLDATHTAGVLHRDLTPRNVLFDRDGTALLADFGIARTAEDPTLTAEHTIMGTRPFVAPERLRGEEATVATDVYAVGITLRYAATGAHVAAMPADHPFRALVSACTDDDPARRPSSAAEAARHLHELTSGQAPLPPTGPLLPEDRPTPDGEDDSTTIVMHREAAGASTPSDDDAAPEEPASSRRPVLVLGLLVTVAAAAMVGSTVVRDDTPDEAATAPADTPAGEPAPTFDPQAPGSSARQLAEWLRGQDG